MDLNSIIFALIIKFIKIFLKALTPYFKFILFIMSYIKLLFALALIYLFIIITIILIEKYRQSTYSKNQNKNSTLEEVDITNPKEDSKYNKEILH